MQVRYEPFRDVLTLKLRQDAPVVHVVEDVRGTVFGYDEEGELVLIEITDATRNIDRIRQIEKMLGRVVKQILGRPGT